MNNLIDQIDAYLDGTLSAEESASFETKMNSDASLREQVDAQRNLRAGIDRIGMKAATTSAFKKITLRNKFYKWGITTVAVAAIATSVYLATTSTSSTSQGPEITYDLPATNENGGTEWADADRNLPTQLFMINPAKDTVIETMGGIVFAIPAGAFTDAKDPMTLEIREALTPMDIMKAGLSTTSNGELLETGGMFYLNARNGETSLKINPDKPVCANVPANEIRPGMQLFEGKRTPDGGINWINPKPMEKPLIPVDIFSLNFYPDGFLEKVAELGFDANNAQVTDSIYYSYAGRQQMGVTTSSDSARVRHILIAYRGAANAGPEVTRTKEQAKSKADDLQRRIKAGENMANLVESSTDDPGSKNGNKGDYGWFTHESGFIEPFKNAGFNNNVGDVVVIETDFGYHVIQVLDKTQPTRRAEYSNSNSNGTDGQALFKANCATCHNTTDQPSTGPGLKGVLSRIPGGNWKYDFVHDPAGMIAEGDPYSNTVDAKYPSVMKSFPSLKNEEIDAVLAYADHAGKPYGMEIDPARIAAIKTPEFQNTLIATKEFEARIRIAFANCEPRIIDMYVNNLDKKMWEIDSMIAGMTWNAPSINADFRYLATLKQGGVAISQPHMKKLQEYYQKKQEAVRLASQKTFEGRTAEQKKQDSIYLAGTNKYQQAGTTQAGENFIKEYNTNLKEAYRQLGIEPYVASPAPAYYTVEVQNPGWCNVDVYVNRSTNNRTTLDYTDPNSGKKAVIKYEELKINIADAANYSQLMVYLVTDSLPCFRKVSNASGEYKENLDKLFEYSLVVIAEKDGLWFSATTPKVTPGTVNVTLNATDESSLRNRLNATYKGKVGSDFGAEVYYMKQTHAYNVRKEKEARQEEIDRQIMEVIFPCAHADYRAEAPVTNDDCENAKAQLEKAKIAAAAIKQMAYKVADDAKAAAYAEADKIEKSYQNPLEKAAKKAAADAARNKADQSNLKVKTDADIQEKASIDAAQKNADAICSGSAYSKRVAKPKP